MADAAPPERGRPRIAVVWPRPRAARWRCGREHPGEQPDQSDALLFLEDEGFEVCIEESLGLPWNPLIRSHEFLSGLDPVRALRVALRARRYQALICVGDATAYVLVKLRALGLPLPPIVLIDPALSDNYPRRRRLQDIVLPSVQAIIVFGQVQLDAVRERYGSAARAQRMLHRIDCEFFRPADHVAADPFVFSIGNDESRDFDTLARAAPLIRQRHDVPFVVQTVRPVPATAGLSVVREHVSFQRLRDLYRGARVVVLPLHDTVHAGGINSLLEAMASGCAVVVSGSRGVADYVADGDTAIVVEPGNPAALAGAISDLLGAPARCRALGERARRVTVDRCANPVYARTLGGIVRNVVCERGHS